MRVLLIAYDNDSYIHHFPLGLAYVAAKLRVEGDEVVVYRQDQFHRHESHLVKFLTGNKYDAVGVGMCAGYYQFRKLLDISEAIYQVNPRPRFIVGGQLVSPDPEYFKAITGADEVYVGEFDYTKNLDSLPYPAWSLFDMNYYTLLRLPHAENRDRCFSVLSGRGCPFHCTFCYRMYEGYRARDIKSIVEEIQILQKNFKVTYIDFCDELLMVGEDRAVEISKALKPLGIKWDCNGRLNYAKPSVLKEMKESGCVFINYGIESVDDEVLRQMNKKLTYQEIVDGVEATLGAGISPGLNMIFGNVGDTKESLWKSVDFLVKYDDQAQLRTIRPVTPYPGCDLFDRAVKEGKLKDTADFYENKHTNSDLLTVNFTNLTDDEYYEELELANRILVENYYSKQQYRVNKQIAKLYRERDTSFRGFRQT